MSVKKHKLRAAGEGERSGGHGPKRARKERPTVEALPATPAEAAPAVVAQTGESKFARALGSTDFHTREKGLAALTRWLAARDAVDDADLLKLWKGVFYCFWHSDKAPVQDDLAQRLAEMQLQFKPKVSLTFLRTFMLTIRREWLGIDRLRLDKFMLLIRYFLRQALVKLKRGGWSSRSLQSLNKLLLEQCLLPTDDYAAAGVAYHMADIFVGELQTVVEGEVLGEATLQELLEPWVTAISATSNQALINRVRDGVFGAVVELYRDAEGVLGAIDGAALAERLFEAAAGEAKSQKNRVALYDLNKTLTKAVKKRGQADTPPDAAATVTKVTIPAAAAAEGNGGVKTSAKKEKKRKMRKNEFLSMAEVKDHEEMENGEGGGKGAKREEAAPAEQPSTSGKEGKSSLKKAKQASSTPKQSAAKVATGSAAAEPSGTAAAQPHDGFSTPPPTTAAPASAVKKSVSFSIKKNLYFPFGGPVPDPDIRTPPHARPKGPALKRVSAFGAEAAKTPNMFGKGKKKGLTPKTAPRARAADFF